MHVVYLIVNPFILTSCFFLSGVRFTADSLVVEVKSADYDVIE